MVQLKAEPSDCSETSLLAAHRRLHAATGSKSDAIDAIAAAHAAIATPDLTRHHIDERVRELRVLTDYRADLVKRRTMMINQLKAQSHLWLDHTPGDLARAKVVAALTARPEAAEMGIHVRQVIVTMISELADANNRIHDLDIRIKELVTPPHAEPVGNNRDQPQLRIGAARRNR
jgi:hypothetical protein